jgi:hypothetical protein
VNTIVCKFSRFNVYKIVNFEDNGIMAKESRTVICRCLLEKLGIDDSI